MEAVASVLEQTLADLELIVIDDGSTDGTIGALATFSDRRVQVFSVSPSGPAAARNLGIARARADYLAFIDSDDVWLPEKLEAQTAALENMPTASIAYCWTNYVDTEGSFICPDRRVVFEGLVYEQMLRLNFIDCGSNILIRKQALLDEGGFDESLPVIEDWDLNLRLSVNHHFACVPRALVHYRQRPTSLSTKVGLMEETFRRVIDQAFSRAPDSMQHIKSRSISNFYEYLTAKSTQDVPTRDKAIQSLRFFMKALNSRPAMLLELWRRPWVIKAVAKALLAIVLPSAAMRTFADLWPTRSEMAS